MNTEEQEELKKIMFKTKEFQAKTTLSVLRQIFPRIIKSKKVVPLKIGICDDIIREVCNGQISTISKKAIKVALKYYTRLPEYILCCEEGSSRFDTKGDESGIVTREEFDHIQNIQSKRSLVVISQEKFHKRIASQDYDISEAQTKLLRWSEKLDSQLRAEKRADSKMKKKKKLSRK